ncbi:MAG: hypothetical protein WC934_01995 [Acidithiobacillus sp.]|jgi:fatty-acid desaturase|uniref:hypothetical protein n=1 Tax=Acidithiobacillus sp. TaxID=1872118 RepID=UPI0035609D24
MENKNQSNDISEKRCSPHCKGYMDRVKSNKALWIIMIIGLCNIILMIIFLLTLPFVYFYILLVIFIILSISWMVISYEKCGYEDHDCYKIVLEEKLKNK